MKRAIIFGVGGVGSHLAYLMTRVNTEWKQRVSSIMHEVTSNMFDELVLVDFDEVEEKNLKRQMFFSLEGNKAEQTKRLLEFREGKVADDSMKIIALNKKVTDELDLAEFDRENDFAFICTDNMESKLILFRFFEHKLMVSCDKDYYEIKTKLDKGDTTVFEFGGENGAYNSAQTFSANIVSAMHLYRLVLNYGWNIPNIIIREKVDSRLECEDKKVIWNPTVKAKEEPKVVSFDKSFEAFLEQEKNGVVENAE